MQDNPSLKPEVIKRYESLYSGVFYERFVKGRWVAVFGAVYPFMDNERMYCDIPSDIESWAVSCDYGTVIPHHSVCGAEKTVCGTGLTNTTSILARRAFKRPTRSIMTDLKS